MRLSILSFGILCCACLLLSSCARVQQYDIVPNDPQSVQCFNEESKTAKNCEDNDVEGALQGEWNLKAFCLNHTTYPLKSDENHNYVLRFEKGAITGSFGCNNFFGSYTIEKGSLKINNAGMTRKLCMEREMLYESKLTENFLNATTKILLLKDTRDSKKTGKVFFLNRDFYLVLDRDFKNK